jgi:hypothetical protein
MDKAVRQPSEAGEDPGDYVSGPDDAPRMREHLGQINKLDQFHDSIQQGKER